MRIERDDKVGIGRDNKVDTGRDNKVGIKRDDNGMGDLGQDDGKAAKLVAGVYTGVRRFLRRIFLLAVCFNTFLAFLSLECVIG